MQKPASIQARTSLAKFGSQISQITYVDYTPNVLEVELLPPVAQFVYPCTERWNANPYGVFGGLSRVAGVNHLCLRMGGTFPEDDGTEVTTQLVLLTQETSGFGRQPKLWKVRSRLYRCRFLQLQLHFLAFFETWKIDALLQGEN